MKIRVRDIKSDGLELNEEVTAQDIGLVTEDYIKVKDPISVKASAQKAENTVLVTVEAQGEFESFCARCLEPIVKNWQKEFFFDFKIQPTTEHIELDEDIRQELMLNFPAKILCRDDCKGLCKNCGVNLNLEKCKCK